VSPGLRRIGDALAPVRSDAAPATLLAAVQELWPRAAGDAVAAEAEPVAEREGVVTVACHSATWANELDLLGPQLLERLLEGLSEGGFEGRLERLRFTADAARHEDSRHLG
jgi:predicted nucleic acid-binding Zn ribbon protein